MKGADLGETDGKLVLDFNFSYNPSCSYDPSWVCPLAPPANRLAVAVGAGEKHRLMSDLEALRSEISELDRRLLELLNRRLELVAAVRDHKDAAGERWIDPEREAELVQALVAANPGPISERGVTSIFSAVLDVLKQEVAADRRAPTPPATASDRPRAVERLAVVGTGLVGTSVALAAGRAGTRCRGFDADPGVLDGAAARGAVEPVSSLAEAVADAELVVVAVPVGAAPAVVQEALDAAGGDTVVTDVASTKRPLASLVDPRFVPGHPVHAVLGPHRAREAVDRVVGQPDRVLLTVEGDHARHRAEDLLPCGPVVVGHRAEHGGREPESGPSGAEPRKATGASSGTYDDTVRSWSSEISGPICVDSSSGSPTEIEPHGALEMTHEAVEGRPLHQDARARAAILARVAEHRRRGGVGRRLHIGVREHHVGRLAAELERHPLDRARRALGDPPADLGRAGEGHLRHVLVLHQPLPAHRAGPGHHVHHALREPASSAIRASSIEVSGVSSAGFSTTVFPAASAGATFQAAIVSGKFHGVMRPTTPSGSRKVMSTPPATGIVFPVSRSGPAA